MSACPYTDNLDRCDCCAEKFSGSYMVPLEYPAAGWEPIMDSDVCTLRRGHDGPHEGKKLKLAR